MYRAFILPCSTGIFPETILTPKTSTSSVSKAISKATASSEAVSVSIKNLRLLIHKGYQIDQTIVGSLIHNCFC